MIWSTSWFVGAIQEALCVCGQDPELVQLVCCYPEDAKVLTTSPEIKHITFIGSEIVGRQVGYHLNCRKMDSDNTVHTDCDGCCCTSHACYS